MIFELLIDLQQQRQSDTNLKIAQSDEEKMAAYQYKYKMLRTKIINNVIN